MGLRIAVLHVRQSGPEGNTWEKMRQARLTAAAVLETRPAVLA